MLEDPELLRRYATDRSEAAFGELVRRHLTPVYACALRQVGGDAHLAEDVAQMVFTALARKAGALTGRQSLGGWLYRTTHFAARDVVRVERRRRTREQEAQTMDEPSIGTEANIDWEKLHPVLDRTMAELNDADRDAVWLRFFEGRSFAEVGARLRVTENAARMRVERALDKLHGLLASRGVTSTTAALGIALGSQATIAAPAGLGAAVTAGALTGAAGTGGILAAAGVFLTMSKIKVGIVGGIVAALLATGFVELRANRALSAELGVLRAGDEDPVRLKNENRALSTVLGKLAANNPEADELAQLSRRVAQLKARPAGVVDSELKPVAAWRNAGWATPEAALETVMWAGSIGYSEELVGNAPFIGQAKVKADAAFANLPEVVRARYQTADRLLGAVCFGSRGAVDDAAARAAYGGTVVAFQVLDTSPDLKKEGMSVRWWEQLSTGEEREKKQTFSKEGNRFTLGENRFSESTWEWIVSQLDPVTGELLPRKLPSAPAKAAK